MTSSASSARRIELFTDRAGYAETSGEHIADFDWFRRALDSEDIWFFTAGRGYLRYRDGREHILRRGVIALLRKGDDVEFHHKAEDEKLCTFYFHFRTHPGDKKSSPAALAIPPLLEVSDTAFYEACFRRVLFLVQSAAAISPSLHASAVEDAQHLFDSILRQLEFEHHLAKQKLNSGVNTHQQQLIFELITKYYQQPEQFWNGKDGPPSPQSYCRDHLARLFRRITGKTPKKVLIEARIEKARNLLRNTNLSIVQIADELGYENQFYFCRQFKSLTGLAPTKFRQRSIKATEK